MRRLLQGLALILLAAALAGCDLIRQSPEYDHLTNVVEQLPFPGKTPGLEAHAVRSSKTVIIHKIAVMPLIARPDQVTGELAQGAAEAVTAEVYARATIIGGWIVLTQAEVEDAMQQFPPSNAADFDQNALALGRKLAVDGVLYGSVHEYRERVGYAYAAQTPAAVAFSLKFVDMKSGQVIWNANFAREQKALTQNVLDLPTFINNSGRWVRAHDLAAQGAKEAIDNLQSKITIEPLLQGQY